MSDNEIIARFYHGEGKWDNDLNCFCTPMADRHGFFRPQSSNFHEWNLLMPVVEKIENLEGCYEIMIRSSHVKARSFNPFNMKDIHTEAIEGEQGSKISAVYKSVVEFIKWYNQQLPKPNEP